MSQATHRKRMPAAERRPEVLDAATHVFAERGWGGATTAAIAQLADINEALVFRYFGSKQALYPACIDASWERVEQSCEALLAAETDVARHWRMPGRTFIALTRDAPHVARLWARALAETTGIPAVDNHLAASMRRAHEYVVVLLERSQAAGGIAGDRDLRAEAWMIVALGWLGITSERLGPDVTGEFDGVLRSHRSWLTGDPE
ncbi:MAG: TetR/AcrR family transcriptional regulator [Thermoleophilia bacterium]|nr:TetR/AcrR family transcriptional regulator [Thermoleophilia bacterium]